MTAHHSVDVAVIGAGFGGSLTALLLNSIGFRVILLERGSHPRFAIGESSTPIADLVLRELARKYHLTALAPLSRYGTWKKAYPDLVCGPKRGFSYFTQKPQHPFRQMSDHGNELLVAASRDDMHADTHWLRSDVDTFVVNQVQAAGIPYLDRIDMQVQEHSPTWKLKGMREGAHVAVEAEFLIDATGEAAFLANALELKSRTHRMRTRSRALFGHFVNVIPWHEKLESLQADTAAHPFRCDAAALHHLLEEGWMWQLHFDNGLTSAGFVLDAERHPLNPEVSAEEEWDELLARYCSLADQFASARLKVPGRGLSRTGRLQRQWTPISGNNWALLPQTAGFVDPFYSSGLAQMICGVEQLVHVLEHHWKGESLQEQLSLYAERIQTELDLIDELVHGSFLSMRRFDLFVPFSMLYFAAATTWEHRRLETGFKPQSAFLCAEDRTFRKIVREVRRNLQLALVHEENSAIAAEFFDNVAREIAPYNRAGLCNPAVGNMYRYTVVDIG